MLHLRTGAYFKAIVFPRQSVQTSRIFIRKSFLMDKRVKSVAKQISL